MNNKLHATPYTQGPSIRVLGGLFHRGQSSILELMTAGQISGYSKAAALLSSLLAAEWRWLTWGAMPNGAGRS